MVDIAERRVTRSLSNELQARAALSSYHRNSHETLNGCSPANQPLTSQYVSHSQAPGQVHDSNQVDLQSNGVGHHRFGSNGGGYDMRNTSEEMFLTNLMNSTGMEASSLGFLDPPPNLHTLRGNSEELFHSWITNHPESSNGLHYGPPPRGNRSRQNSRRISSELQGLLSQPNGSQWPPRPGNEDQTYLQTNSYLVEDVTTTHDGNYKPQSNNPSKDKGGPGPADYNPLGALKSFHDWFSSRTPMTRNRSSELRRRYAELEGLPFPPSADTIQKLAANGTLETLVNQGTDVPSFGAFPRGIGSYGSPQNDQDSKPTCPQLPLSPHLSKPATEMHKQEMYLQTAVEQQGHSVVSDAVGLLMGSLERKKNQTKQEQQQQQQQQQGLRSMPSPMSPPQANIRQEESFNRQQMHAESGLVQVGQVQQTSVPRPQSPSGSSGGAPSYSAGIATSDGPSTSGMSVHRQALKRGNGAVDQPSPKHRAFSIDSPGAQNTGDVYENGTPKIDMAKKSDHLARAGSITSSLRPGFQLNDIDDATKKRRVERQKKMAEAKGRGNAPPLPADLQAAIKRCDALEKEVRSLKLNLSFMNRKDSEQTTRIEELEQQNEELKDEKERLLEELERLSAMSRPPD